MSRKHTELEREFIEDLEPRTGRSLAAWMSAIDATGLSDRNAIIDWLRPQGLTFAHASWLERIHHNDGRPIYLGMPGRQPPAVEQGAPLPPPVLPQPPTPRAAPPAAPAAPPVVRPAPPSQPAAASRSAPLPAGSAGSTVADILARAKGLKPLADLLLREIAATLPTSAAVPSGDAISIRNPAEFAVLVVSPRELRLGLTLGSHPVEAGLVRSRLAGTEPSITHMMVIADARLVGPPLLELVKRADAETNPKP
jgi:hypothetical protein